MNCRNKNILKQCAIFIFMQTVLIIHPMNIKSLNQLLVINRKNEKTHDPIETMKNMNHLITINSKINKSDSMLQLYYSQKEPHQESLVGMHNIISIPETFKCFMSYPKKQKYPSIFTLSDPYSKEKILRFKAIDGSLFTIHAKKDNIISITGSWAARYIIKKEEDEEKEYIVVPASEEEKELGRFTY